MATTTGFTSSKSSLNFPKLNSHRPSHHSSSFLIFRTSTAVTTTTILTCSSNHRCNTILAASLSSGDGINGGNGHNHGGGGGGEGKGGDGNAGDKNKAEALIALAEIGRSLESLPKDLAAAIESGRIPKSIVVKYLELEKSPIFRWLLQFGGFRERLLADDLFLAKIGMECGVGIFTKVALGGSSFTLLQRIGAIMVGTVLTNALINARKAVDKSSAGEVENVPIFSTSVAYGVYMAVSSNLRYLLVWIDIVLGFD